MKDETKIMSSTSLAVRQFCAVAFGREPVHKPTQPWKVEQVIAEEKYCLRCFGVRTFDVLLGGRRQAAVCRCCGEEVIEMKKGEKHK